MSYGKRVGIHRFSRGISSIDTDILAHESLIHIYVNEVKITSLLGTPNQLKELFVGYLLAEGYGDFRSSSIATVEENELSFQVHGGGFLSKKSPSPGIVTTSCGACNSDNLFELNSEIPMFSSNHLEYIHGEVFQALQEMKTSQSGFKETGGMHAAALWNQYDGLRCLSEDIGRHNAVDKAIGTAALLDINLSEQFLLLSGRCGWDLVAKAARSGIGSIASIGACSSLAADTARQLGLRIFSFMKKDTCVIIGGFNHLRDENP